MTATIAGTCSRTKPQCIKFGVARCVTCKTWYCSAQCQAAHWPRHWRDCLPLPDLEWLVQDDKNQEALFVRKGPSLKVRPLGDSSYQVVRIGSAKCVICKTWYCSAQCQAVHWPRPWRESLPLPDLEWLVAEAKNREAVFVIKDPSYQVRYLGESEEKM